MGFGAIHSGHRSPEWRAAPPPSFAREPSADASVTSASGLCGLCVSTLSLNLGLLTVNSPSYPQPPFFHNLAHYSTTSQKSPLCFHNLTNCFPRNSFPLITKQIARGCTPPSANSFCFNGVISAQRPCTHVTTRSRLAARMRAALVYPEPRRAARADRSAS